MLVELRVRELGVIADLDVVLGPGLTVITGETGAGKTLVVDALELLLGGRTGPGSVRSGAEEALVEGRFVDGDDELVLARAIPANGRSRAFVDAKMAPLSALEDLGRDLVDLYGQHAHQSLLRPSTQRHALDDYAGVDLAPLRALRRELGELDEQLGALGGDERQIVRELDLLRFELAEIEQAAIDGPDEEARLEAEEEELAAASSLREAATAAYEALEGASSAPGVVEDLGAAVDLLARHGPLAAHEARLRSLLAELADASSELRLAAERFEEDPDRLASVRARRQLLRALVRKHGEALADVLAAAEGAAKRIAELESSDEVRAALEERRAELLGEIASAEALVGDVRRASAHSLARAVESTLRTLALGRARVEIRLPAEGLADEVEFLLAANRGEDPLPLARVASGGELARTMLALRLVLTASPPTLVFDEVDAGIGGEAAVAVGRALAELATRRQVLVVTHLAQVAAFADSQLVVTKREERGRTLATITPVEGEERLVELSRMLSGHPDSEAARAHAAELLAEAGRPGA